MLTPNSTLFLQTWAWRGVWWCLWLFTSIFLPVFFVLRSCSVFSFSSLPPQPSHIRLITSLLIPTCAHVTPAFLSRFSIFLWLHLVVLLLFFNNNETIVPHALRHQCLHVARVISVSKDAGCGFQTVSEQRPQVWERYWKKILLSRVKWGLA